MKDRILLVLHKINDTLSYYEVESGRELASIPTNRFPHELALSPDRSRLYITEMGLRGVESEGAGGNTVAVYSIREKRRVGLISTDPYRRPHGIATHSSGKLFVTSEDKDYLLIYDVKTASLVHAVEVGQRIPHEVAVTEDGKTAYTANIGSDSLTAIDVEDGEALYNIPVLSRPEGMAFSNDGNYLYAVNRESSAVAIVHTGQRKMIGRIETGNGPVRIVITPDGRYIAFPLFHQDAMQIADTELRKVVETIPVGKQPAGTAMSQDGRLLFVSCEIENMVYVISMETFGVVNRIPTQNGPDAMVCMDRSEVE